MNKENTAIKIDKSENDLKPLHDFDLESEDIKKDPAYVDKYNKALSEIEELSSTKIIHFGEKAQAALTEVSDAMLSGVKNKETGPAGDLLAEMVTVINGFQTKKVDPNKKQSLWDKLLRKAKPIVLFKMRYEEVLDQVESIAGGLEKHKETLLHDIDNLDKLYSANLDYFHDLEVYINAGKEKINELDNNIIPSKKKQVEKSNEMLDAQKLSDVKALREELSRRVHDLQLTRQVVMQALPSIRLVQNNNKGLVNKINSTIVNTLPLWRQQLTQAITIYRSKSAAETLKAASDLTNNLLQANAKNLKKASKITQEEIERGVFDINSIEQANKDLLMTIKESIKTNAEASLARDDAVKRLEKAESDLKNVLQNKKSK